ncbi:hypothetical protein DID77_00940 [Candidatus Marinamargulisbacteria bacterium SCGC AG-439-L15]|nr:hypothetical protein DID77_00940 [Candidatus Marinamargulisbacteria bacterium SCGC AG-439-L15]
MSVFPPVHNILVVRPDAMGDVILSLPFLASLKATYPNSKLTVLLHPMNLDILEQHPSVDEIILDWQATKQKRRIPSREYVSFITQKAFDTCFLLFSDPFYVSLAHRAKIPYRIGDGDKVFLRRFMTHPVPQVVRDFTQHVVEQNLALLTGFNPQANLDLIPQLPVDDGALLTMRSLLSNLGWDGKGRVIGIHPFTGGHNRAWYPERYQDLITHCCEAGYFVVLTGAGAHEESLCAALSQSVPDTVINMSGKTTVRELKALISCCDVFIGTDTGPLHMAAALHVPVLCLSPTKFVKSMHWGPWGAVNEVVSDTSTCPYSCNPQRCQKPNCLDAIQVDRVVEVLRRLLKSDKQPMIDRRTWFRSSLSIAYVIDTLDEAIETRVQSYLDRCSEGQVSAWIVVRKKRLYSTVCESFPSYKRQVLYLPRYRLIYWLRWIVARDISMIHLLSGKASFGLRLIRQVVALFMYAPPVIVTFFQCYDTVDSFCEGYKKAISQYFKR